jgi:trk system potassium uptake protein TrkA
MHLIDPILKEDHKLTIVEESQELCQVLSKRHQGISVVNGDGTDPGVLGNPEVRVADVFVAATESDGANIKIAQLAKELGIPHVIVFINNARNIPAAKKAGADRILCPTEYVVTLFTEEIKRVGIATLLREEDEDYELVRFTVLPGSPLVGKRLRELDIPEKCRIGMVRRGHENIIPKGDFSFQAMDKLFIYGTIEHVEKLIKLLEKLS